jgi:hypothetical protein
MLAMADARAVLMIMISGFLDVGRMTGCRAGQKPGEVQDGGC